MYQCLFIQSLWIFTNKSPERGVKNGDGQEPGNFTGTLPPSAAAPPPAAPTAPWSAWRCTYEDPGKRLSPVAVSIPRFGQLSMHTRLTLCLLSIKDVVVKTN